MIEPFEFLSEFLSEPQFVCYGIEPLLLSSSEAAKALSISERSLWTLTKTEQIPCIKLGRSIRYSVDSLKDWINTHGQHLTR